MKTIITLIIMFLSFNVYSKMPTDYNTGVNIQLNSSSNCRPAANFWQAWVCGLNGTIIRSRANFSSWINVTGHGVPTNVNLTNISAVDSQTAFVCGTLGTSTWIWKTTNAGTNWYQIFTQTNGFINGIYMRNNLQGFIEGNPVGGRWSLWKTTNGGVSWDSTGLYVPQSGTETGLPNSLLNPLTYYYTNPNDTNKIWFGTNNYKIYYSSNYGGNWTSLATPAEQNIYCMTYGYDSSQMTLYAGGSTYLLKSTNNGFNWTNVDIGGTGVITGITHCCFGGYYATRGNKIYYKGFSGNWISWYTAPSGIYTYVDNRGGEVEWTEHYAVRTNGMLTMMTEGEGVQKIGTDIPKEYSLKQNYPNPFNPSTKIKFSIPSLPLIKGVGGMDVKSMIYDILGREVATLVNEKLQPGSYEVEFNGTNYPSGVYFYKLQTETFTETKRMVLIK